MGWRLSHEGKYDIKWFSVRQMKLCLQIEIERLYALLFIIRFIVVVVLLMRFVAVPY